MLFANEIVGRSAFAGLVPKDIFVQKRIYWQLVSINRQDGTVEPHLIFTAGEMYCVKSDNWLSD